MPQQFSVSVSGLSRLERIPGGLDRAQKRFLETAGDRLATSVRLAAPKKSGDLAASIRSQTIGATRLRIHTGSPYAKAQDKGAYITPKGHPFLRFSGAGGQVFVRAVRLPATNFFQKGLRPRRTIINGAYTAAFGRLEGV